MSKFGIRKRTEKEGASLRLRDPDFQLVKLATTWFEEDEAPA